MSGRQATCDIKKGKYIYLICHDPNNPDKRLWVKEDAVTDQVMDVMQSIQVPKESLPEIINHIRDIHKNEIDYHHSAIDKFNEEIKLLDSQMDKITDLLITDSIDKGAYDRKFSQLQNRRYEISTRREEHHTGNEQFKMALITLVTLASRASDIFKSSIIEEKRQLLGYVFSNFSLNGAKLQYTLAEPFKTFVNLEDLGKWCCV